ncbi:MAG TPA: NUDIX domain-containing protein [Chitinophagaceae bacterium]|nr:NUDIX domain-containing protein [Chitinophagaceae bacterium]
MYSHIPPINIRVYGIWIKNKMVFIAEEEYLNKPLIKFPGGGLEYGEGTISCLKREFREELNTEINIKKHFYTTDHFQKSLWDDRQVLSIYYLVDLPNNFPNSIENKIGNFYFANKNEAISKIHLPIDKIVLNKLLEENLI